MDGSRFDDLTRAMAHGVSRRRVIKGLAGGLAAGAAVLLGRAETYAQGVTQAYCGNKVCANDPSVCNDGCVCCGFGNGNNRCMPWSSCQRLAGEIVCPEGQMACAGSCLDPTSDLQNCGTCDNNCRLAPVAGSCEQDPICVAGQCGFTPQSAGTICRTASGVCDSVAVCDGSTTSCPSNPFQPNTVECRAAAGQCDVAEYCTGDSAVCPRDGFVDATVQCRAASCVNGVATPAANCPGDSAECPTVETKRCAPYLCGATACLESCAGPDHEGCIAGYHCDGGQCLPDEGLGNACDEASDCVSGVCNPVSHICCSEECPPGADCTGANFTCGVPCIPACTGKECGDNGCGGTCGDCTNSLVCEFSGTCVSSCGGYLDNCCDGNSCDDGLMCGLGGYCLFSCGEPGEVSCFDGTCLDGSPPTIYDMCEPCGDKYQVCCKGGVCDTDLICGGIRHDTICHPVCGEDGMPCCSGGSCEDGLVCGTNQICAQPACGIDRSCDGGLVCAIGNVCVSACGGAGEPCCVDGSCPSAHVCLNNICSPCGTYAEHCCNGGTCNSGLVCDVEDICLDSCGEPGDFCCSGAICYGGSRCSIYDTCEPCGGENQACCYNGVCNAGFICGGPQHPHVPICYAIV